MGHGAEGRGQRAEGMEQRVEGKDRGSMLKAESSRISGMGQR
jgi:hypothetical protein